MTDGDRNHDAAKTPPPTARTAAKPIPRPLPEKPVYRISTGDEVAFLTIDDGAYKDPEMIRVLREAGITPTLFLTDQYAKQDPGFFRRMRDETGTAIENHARPPQSPGQAVRHAKEPDLRYVRRL